MSSVIKMNKKISGIYIHFPFCKIKCGYCDFYSITDRESSIPLFIESLEKEIELYFQKNSVDDMQFNSIFLGGGTPSIIPSEYIEKLFLKLSSYIDINTVEEITIEANPGESPKDRLKEYRALGINRISFGFQSLDNNLLKFLDRLHQSNDCIIAYNDARDVGFDNINTDMIFNIPGQSIETLTNDLMVVAELGPEHISCYSLTVEKGTMLYNNVSSGKVKMPDENLDYDMYRTSSSVIKDAGYNHYEASNYAKTSRRCAHNLHYWNLDPYLAFGPSAHGYDGNKRWWNHKSLDKYISDIQDGKLPVNNSESLTTKDHYNEMVMNGLRTSTGINTKKLISLNEKTNFDDMISRWPQLTMKDDYLKLANNDFMLLDEIASDLFL